MAKSLFSFILFLTFLSPAYAMPPFTGEDFSGEYVCKGRNDSVGDYEVLVTLKLNEVTSHDMYGVYDFSTETNNQATYAGQIMAKKRQFSMTFKLLGSEKFYFSTGMGSFKKNKHNRWSFNSTYYEPDGKGGNFGYDHCTIKEPVQAKNKSSKKSHKPSKSAS